MNYSTPLEYLKAKLEEERVFIINHLVQGSLDVGEYKRLCGALQGLDLAKNHINDLAKRMETDDE
jgi:hypothetical protein